MVLPTPEQEAALPVFPSPMPSAWLSPENHPRLVGDKDDLLAARENVTKLPWARSWLETQREIAAPFAKMSDERLRGLVPPPGSKFIIGVAFNTDPVKDQRLEWGGWKNPFKMFDTSGRAYPNREWPDTGEGGIHPKTGQPYHFLAPANTAILRELETTVLPALAAVAVLDESPEHARAAAVLLDAIAAVAPTTFDGPIDAPIGEHLRNYKGRLHRATLQVGRTMEPLGQVIDLIASTGALQTPSGFLQGATKAENVARNFLWDSGSYCLLLSRNNFGHSNGQVDAMRGAAITGILLGQAEFTAPLFLEQANIDLFIANTVDADGFYFENSIGYERHMIEMLYGIAEITRAGARLGFPGAASLYENPEFLALLGPLYDRRQIGGRVPVTGNISADMASVPPGRRSPPTPEAPSDPVLATQWESAWRTLLRAPSEETAEQAASIIRSMRPEDGASPPAALWFVFHARDSHFERIARTSLPDAARRYHSEVFGGKGLALLRGGDGDQPYGAQLFFGAGRLKNQDELLTWIFVSDGTDWAFDPGRFHSHFRFGWANQAVAHQAVVFNRQSPPSHVASGELLAFHDGEIVQWASATQSWEQAGEPVRLSRLIAQAARGTGGESPYWLDVSLAEGGATRTDSFHSRFADVSTALPLVPTGKPALFGDVDLGRRVDGAFNVKGFAGGFYDAPPGHGFGFLGSPRSAALMETTRVVFTNPTITLWRPRILVADLDGAPGRTLFVADGPRATGLPAVPYILREDSGIEPSAFAKLVRAVESAEADPIARFERLASNPRGGIWLVTWKSGARDLWSFQPGGAEEPQVAAIAELGGFASDARVAWLRLDADGRPLQACISGGTRLVWNDRPLLEAPPEWTGTIELVEEGPGVLAVRVSATQGEAAPRLTAPQLAIIGDGRNSQPRQIRSIDGNQIFLSPSKLEMARIRAEVDPYGRILLSVAPSQFLDNAGVRMNPVFLRDRAAVLAGQMVGRVRDIFEKPPALSLTDEPPPELPANLELRLHAFAAGDSIRLLRNSRWPDSEP